MEYLELASRLGFTPLNLVLMVMLYFMGANTGIFPKLWKETEKEEKEEYESDIDLHRSLLNQMRTLSSHFNHETTELLTKISASLELLTRKHEEWEKYGIPTRECKKKHK